MPSVTNMRPSLWGPATPPRLRPRAQPQTGPSGPHLQIINGLLSYGKCRAQSTHWGGKQRQTDPFPFLSLVLPHSNISVAGASPSRALSHTIKRAASYSSLSSPALTSPDSPTAAPGKWAPQFRGCPALFHCCHCQHAGHWPDTQRLLLPFRNDVLPLAFLPGTL